MADNSIGLFSDVLHTFTLDKDIKRNNENPSIGILLCQSADQSVVEYAMSRSLSPTMVAECHCQLIPQEII